MIIADTRPEAVDVQLFHGFHLKFYRSTVYWSRDRISIPYSSSSGRACDDLLPFQRCLLAASGEPLSSTPCQDHPAAESNSGGQGWGSPDSGTE